MPGWVFAGALALGVSASAAPQSFAQHGELFTQGSITDAGGRVWDVRFIPGTSELNENLVEGWVDAGETLLELFEGSLWVDDIPEEIGDGFRFSRDVVTDHFVEGIADDVRETLERNRELQSGDFGRGFIVSWNWMKATAAIFGRTIWLPVGTTGGVTYAASAPVLMVAWRPVEATLHASVRGVAVPAVGHVWNTTAWSATFFNAVPERETRWVSRRHGVQDVVLGAAELDAFLRGTVAESVVREQQETVKHEIAAEQERMRALQEEHRKRAAALHALDQSLEANEAFREKRRVREDLRFSGSRVLDDEAVRAYADNAGLDARIRAALEAQGVEPTPERIARTRAKLREELDALLEGPARR
jgi:hypothetical protein